MEIHTLVNHIRVKITDSKLKNKNILLTQLRDKIETCLSTRQTKTSSLHELCLFIEIVEIDLTLLENEFLQA